jgi:putative addiction module component (TIGR02574 family)
MPDEELEVSGTFSKSNVPVPPGHREELDRRLADYEKDPDRLLTLEDLQVRVEAGR